MASNKISLKIPEVFELNLIVTKEHYLNYVHCFFEIQKYLDQDLPVPSKLITELVDCLQEKGANELLKIKNHIDNLTNNAYEFFKSKDYDFKVKSKQKELLYSFPNPLDGNATDSTPVLANITVEYTLRECIKGALFNYHLYPSKKETKETYKRDAAIKHFYNSICDYVKDLKKDPFLSKKTGKMEYKKKALAAYLAHITTKGILNGKPLTVENLFAITSNAFKK